MKPFLEAMVKLSSKNMKTALKASKSAVGATGTLASKLSLLRQEVLEACAGYDCYDNEDEAFVPPPVYAELEAGGWTKEACYTSLNRRCVETKGSRNRSNVHVTPRMVLTFKSGNFASGRDQTYEGCTSGVTVFAVPHLSQKMAYEDTLDHNAYTEATHKTQADNKNFLSGKKFLPPKSLSEVIRVLNNYIVWLDVMFGSNCPHLIQVIRLRDALDENEIELELALCKHLRLSILWKIHVDARYFFNQCERWRRGEPLPKSRLHGTVDILEYDQQVIKSLTCPFEDFFGLDKKDKTKRDGGGGGGGGGGADKGKDGEPKTRQPREAQAPTNPTIPVLCAAAVNKVLTSFPGMTITKFAGDSGIPVTKFVIGARGGCTNWQLLGTCKAQCSFKHTPCTVTDEKQKEVAALLLEGLKTLEGKRKATPP